MSSFQNWKLDFRASVVVFLVALPLCLGISLASGAPLISGVIGGIIGGLIIGAFSNSAVSVSGPAAGLTVIVLTAIQSMGDFHAFTLAVLLAGVIQFAMGCFKFGEAGGYFPTSVVKGMLSAIGLILIMKQIPHATGYDADFMGDMDFHQPDGQNTFSELVNAASALNWAAIIISVTCIVVMVSWEKLAKKGNVFFQTIPGALVAVLIGVIAQVLIFPQFDSLELGPEHLVNMSIEPGIASFFAQLQFPNWSAWNHPDLLRVAFTIAIVASLETLLSVEAVDKIDPKRRTTSKNQELIAQGIGNSVSGLVGGLPLTAVIVRSSANLNAGAVSKRSAILHGFWLLSATILIPQYLELIPLSALAAVLILVGLKLTPLSLYVSMFKKGWDQFLPYVVTVLAILFTDLLTGILIGIFVGLFFLIKSSNRKSVVMVNEENDYLLRFMKDVSFLQKPKVAKMLSSIPNGANVLIDGTNSVEVDPDIVSAIEDFICSCESREIKCEVKRSSLALNPFFKEQA